MSSWTRCKSPAHCVRCPLSLVRRRPLALKAGAVFLAFAFLRQGSGLVMALSATPPEVPGVESDAIRTLAPVVTASLLLSLAWLVFVLWKFCQPSIRAEFVGGVDPSTDAPTGTEGPGGGA